MAGVGQVGQVGQTSPSTTHSKARRLPPQPGEQTAGQCDWDGQAVGDGNVKKGSYS